MDFIETEVDYYAVDVGFSTVIVHDENGDEPDVTFVRKDALDRLSEENAKFRELVKDLCNCMRGCCDDLGGCHVFRGKRGWCFVSKELKELGVEVDDGGDN